MDPLNPNPNPNDPSAEQSVAPCAIPSASTGLHGNGNGNESESESESDSKRQKVCCDPDPGNKTTTTTKTTTTLNCFRHEENPLENDVILRNLLKVCGHGDLFNFRLVSRQWNNIATHVLKNSKFVLTLVYNPREKGYTNGTVESCERLSKLDEILSTSPDFPVVNYRFERGDLGSSEAQKFFKNHGDKIKLLILNLNNNNNNNADISLPHTEINTLRKILLEHATEVNELLLESIPLEWQQEDAVELFPEPRNTIQLPQLKWLRVKPEMFTSPKSYRLVQDIIQAAVNLKRVTGYKIEFLDPHASAFENKIHVLKQISFSPREDNLDLYLKFGEGEPKLERMEISDALTNNIENSNGNNNAKKIAQALQLILESSKDTLEQITGYLPLSPLLSHLKLPRMSRIKSLCISFIPRELSSSSCRLTLLLDPHRSIHKPLPLAQMFPNLVSVAILIPLELSPERNFLDHSQPLLSVKGLVILGPYPAVEKLAALFPAVLALTIFTPCPNFPKLMVSVWKGFPNLDKLELSIVISESDEIVTEKMDAAICGFSPETCLQLKTNSRNVKFEDVDALRENPSICDATKLSTLNIHIKIPSTKVITRPLFSIVTGIFGFDLMRKKGGQVNFKAAEIQEQCRKIALSEIVRYIDSE